MSSKQRGECRVCHNIRELPAKGLCSSCYQRDLRRGVTIDCFARALGSARGACRVMAGVCIGEQGKACPFRKTQAEYSDGRTRAIERIRSLPETQREYITQTYLTQKEGTK